MTEYIRQHILGLKPYNGDYDFDNNLKIDLKDLWLSKNVSNAYKIKVNYSGHFEAEDLSIVNMAAARWSQIITKRTFPHESFAMIINVEFDPNLNENILGQAGVTDYSYTNGKFIPKRGIMILSTKNWSNQKKHLKDSGFSNAYYTVLHEMGHIFGIGTMWDTNNLTDSSRNYIGANALKEYRTIIGDPNVPYLPVENDGGSGTAWYHPEEGVESTISDNDRVYYKDGHSHPLPGLDHELMTGWAEVDTSSEPLSTISVGFLHDVGFDVNYDMADEYNFLDMNKTDGFLNYGEKMQLIFYENQKQYSTYVNGQDTNKISYNLYIASENRYLVLTKLKCITSDHVVFSHVKFKYVGDDTYHYIQFDGHEVNINAEYYVKEITLILKST
jgi:hypothetical protein